MPLLTESQKQDFARDGFLFLPGFYDLLREIEPIQRAIHAITGLTIARHQLDITQKPFSPEHFDSGFQPLIAANRTAGSTIYDAVKQIPAFVRLVADVRHEQLFEDLRPGSLPVVAGGGYGIRIDNPGEDLYRAPWHQEYPAQLRSMDGLVLWSPLVQITPELGPVKICRGSHRLGPIPVYTRDPRNPDKTGAYSLILHNEEELVNNFEQVEPLPGPGDLLLMDFMTVHASGFNLGQHSRWSMQFRFFNFREPAGIKMGWRGSFAAGVDFRSLHPELCLD